MANSSIMAPTRFGVRKEITLPYTAPSDGFVTVKSAAPAGSSWAYDYIAVGGATSSGVCNIMTNGLTVTGSAPVCKGEYIGVSASNISSGDRKVYFVPLVGG